MCAVDPPESELFRRTMILGAWRPAEHDEYMYMLAYVYVWYVGMYMYLAYLARYVYTHQPFFHSVYRSPSYVCSPGGCSPGGCPPSLRHYVYMAEYIAGI